MKKKRILALFLAAVSCLSLAVSASAAGTTTRKATDFKDYDRTAWYAEAVSAAVDNGLLYGKSATVIDPNGDMTRAEMAAIINRSFGCYKTADISQYKDVSKSKWYYKDVALAVQMGTYNGRSSSSMAPDAPITRAEMAKIISLFAKLDKSESRFSDIAGHWAEAYIKLAAGNGWIAGYRDGTFGPQRNITRAETATMINRVLDRVPSEESHLLSRGVMQIWPDANPGDWFYLAMQEATNSHDYERNAKWAAADEQWTALRETRDWKALEQ